MFEINLIFWIWGILGTDTDRKYEIAIFAILTNIKIYPGLNMYIQKIKTVFIPWLLYTFRIADYNHRKKIEMDENHIMCNGSKRTWCHQTTYISSVKRSFTLIFLQLAHQAHNMGAGCFILYLNFYMGTYWI